MTETVTLREITEKSVRPICALSDTLSPSHKKMVADNAISIAGSTLLAPCVVPRDLRG